MQSAMRSWEGVRSCTRVIACVGLQRSNTFEQFSGVSGEIPMSPCSVREDTRVEP